MTSASTPWAIPAWFDQAIAAGFPLAAGADLVAPPPGCDWLPAEHLRHPGVVEELVHRYASWLGAGRLAAAAACLTQHYAGRLCCYAVAGWVATGSVPDLEIPGLYAAVDEHARIPLLGVSEQAMAGPGIVGDVDGLVAAILRHLKPMLDQARTVGHITDRVAWGGVATSVAGAFACVVRQAPPCHRARVEAAARKACTSPVWPGDRPLVTWPDLPIPADGPSHRRHTCCLIFLSPTHEECLTCPRREHQPAS